MCRWRSGPQYVHPATNHFEYALQMDADAYIPFAAKLDIFKWMANDKLTYGFMYEADFGSHSNSYMWDLTKLYMQVITFLYFSSNIKFWIHFE